MESRLRGQTHQLMKALEGFYPFVKNAEEQISILEGDVENLTQRKKSLDSDIAEKIKKADMILALDHKKTKEKLDAADALLESAQAIYFELYKAQITKICPPKSYVEEKILPKIEDTKKKIKEASIA